MISDMVLYMVSDMIYDMISDMIYKILCGIINMDSLITYRALGYNKIHLGRNFDGGYVIIDNLDYDIYISCGLGGDISFDEDFMRRYEIDGIGIDGTIEAPEKMPERFTYVPKLVASYNDDKHTNLLEYCEKYNNIFLKMDIEGCEWKYIIEHGCIILPKCKQIVIELHGLFDDSRGANVNEKLLALEILSRTHNIVHAHGNNHELCGIYQGIVDKEGRIHTNVRIPIVLELTYLRKDVCNFELNDEPFPDGRVDFACNFREPDIYLNDWPFVIRK
jgi:hypothetical protein